MSDMMDKSTKSPDEDTASLKSNGKSPTDGGVKKLSMMQSLRKSIRHVAEKNPLSPGGKGSKVTTPTGSQLPPSPCPGPMKNHGNQKKVEDKSNVTQQKSKSLPRSQTDPDMSTFGNSSTKKTSWYRSLNLGNKRRDKACRPVVMDVFNGPNEEEEVEVEVEVAVAWSEEMFTLPEIPSTPLSVMEISKLMMLEELEEAYLHLLALRREFQQERDQCGDESPMELVKKEKDLNLLYEELRSKVSTIVRDSNSVPSINKGLLGLVACIIQEEEKRAEEPGGLPGSWQEGWREAVGKGVQAKVESVNLEKKEQNKSWLAVHLGLLGTAIVQDLETVKTELQRFYPPSFNVFSTYVNSYHSIVGQHLEKLEKQATELKDLYALLDWIINTYKSERIMGNPSLQPDMNAESTDLQLEKKFLEKLKEKYCDEVQVELSSLLTRIIDLEKNDFWGASNPPEKDEDFLMSELHMDIGRNVKSYVVHSRKIDAELEKRIISSCFKALENFLKTFQDQFNEHCSRKLPEPLWTDYHITYINSFTALQQHMDEYVDTCSEGKKFRKDVETLTEKLTECLEDRFKKDVQPHLRTMMTRTWLNNDEHFNQLYQKTELFSEHCALMRPPHAQALASKLHYYVVKEYVSQLMKKYYSCKNRKHKRAADKIRRQCNRLMHVFKNMKSTHEWLNHVGNDLSDVIGQKNKMDINDHLEPLMEHYPDFTQNHLIAVLNFRGLKRGRGYEQILQQFKELKKKLGDTGGDKSRLLFNDMQVAATPSCMPVSCLRF